MSAHKSELSHVEDSADFSVKYLKNVFATSDIFLPQIPQKSLPTKKWTIKAPPNPSWQPDHNL